MYTVSKAKKGVKYKVIEPEEFWTEKRRERFRRMSEPVPYEEEIVRLVCERAAPAMEKYWAQRAKQREQEAKLAGQKDSKPT